MAQRPKVSEKVKRDVEYLKEIAKKLFDATGKNAYDLKDMTIKNFEELKNNLDKFTVKEANWVASWIEYLGDKTTADRIRQAPNEFKKIINNRYGQLKTAMSK
jgi:predicted unusual protein kinase regulating ubiquinone biosynthesis (AarF/ABC1/UbiB family)